MKMERLNKFLYKFNLWFERLQTGQFTPTVRIVVSKRASFSLDFARVCITAELFIGSFSDQANCSLAHRDDGEPVYRVALQTFTKEFFKSTRTQSSDAAIMNYYFRGGTRGGRIQSRDRFSYI